jgi:hypothetical protein
MNLYKDDFTDFLMKDPKSNPRYAGLARKALSYYLGEKYDPATFDYDLEFFIRNIIESFVELKVFDKEPYDWPFIDNFLKLVLFDQGYTRLEVDRTKFEKGYNGVIRGELPEYRA